MVAAGGKKRGRDESHGALATGRQPGTPPYGGVHKIQVLIRDLLKECLRNFSNFFCKNSSSKTQVERLNLGYWRV